MIVKASAVSAFLATASMTVLEVTCWSSLSSTRMMSSHHRDLVCSSSSGSSSKHKSSSNGPSVAYSSMTTALAGIPADSPMWSDDLSSRANQIGPKPSHNNVKYQETLLRQLYDAWRDKYDRGDFDADRFRIFKANYWESQRAHALQTARAQMDGRPLPKMMELNAYGDCTREEYQELKQAEENNSIPPRREVTSDNKVENTEDTEDMLSDTNQGTKELTKVTTSSSTVSGKSPAPAPAIASDSASLTTSKPNDDGNNATINTKKPSESSGVDIANEAFSKEQSQQQQVQRNPSQSYVRPDGGGPLPERRGNIFGQPPQPPSEPIYKHQGIGPSQVIGPTTTTTTTSSPSKGPEKDQGKVAEKTQSPASSKPSTINTTPDTPATAKTTAGTTVKSSPPGGVTADAAKEDPTKKEERKPAESSKTKKVTPRTSLGPRTKSNSETENKKEISTSKQKQAVTKEPTRPPPQTTPTGNKEESKPKSVPNSSSTTTPAATTTTKQEPSQPSSSSSSSSQFTGVVGTANQARIDSTPQPSNSYVPPDRRGWGSARPAVFFPKRTAAHDHPSGNTTVLSQDSSKQPSQQPKNVKDETTTTTTTTTSPSSSSSSSSKPTIPNASSSSNPTMKKKKQTQFTGVGMASQQQQQQQQQQKQQVSPQPMQTPVNPSSSYVRPDSRGGFDDRSATTFPKRQKIMDPITTGATTTTTTKSTVTATATPSKPKPLFKAEQFRDSMPETTTTTKSSSSQLKPDQTGGPAAVFSFAHKRRGTFTTEPFPPVDYYYSATGDTIVPPESPVNVKQEPMAKEEPPVGAMNPPPPPSSQKTNTPGDEEFSPRTMSKSSPEAEESVQDDETDKSFAFTNPSVEMSIPPTIDAPTLATDDSRDISIPPRPDSGPDPVPKRKMAAAAAPPLTKTSSSSTTTTTAAAVPPTAETNPTGTPPLESKAQVSKLTKDESKVDKHTPDVQANVRMKKWKDSRSKPVTVKEGNKVEATMNTETKDSSTLSDKAYPKFADAEAASNKVNPEPVMVERNAMLWQAGMDIEDAAKERENAVEAARRQAEQEAMKEEAKATARRKELLQRSLLEERLKAEKLSKTLEKNEAVANKLKDNVASRRQQVRTPTSLGEKAAEETSPATFSKETDSKPEGCDREGTGLRRADSAAPQTRSGKVGDESDDQLELLAQLSSLGPMASTTPADSTSSNASKAGTTGSSATADTQGRKKEIEEAIQADFSQGAASSSSVDLGQQKKAEAIFEGKVTADIEAVAKHEHATNEQSTHKSLKSMKEDTPSDDRVMRQKEIEEALKADFNEAAWKSGANLDVERQEQIQAVFEGKTQVQTRRPSNTTPSVPFAVDSPASRSMPTIQDILKAEMESAKSLKDTASNRGSDAIQKSKAASASLGIGSIDEVLKAEIDAAEGLKETSSEADAALRAPSPNDEATEETSFATPSNSNEKRSDSKLKPDTKGDVQGKPDSKVHPPEMSNRQRKKQNGNHKKKNQSKKND